MTKIVDSGGNETTAIYASDGRLQEVTRGHDGESYLYGYNKSGINEGLLNKVIIRRPINDGFEIVRSASYRHEGDLNVGIEQADSNRFNWGNLKEVTISNGSGDVVSREYFRFKPRTAATDPVQLVAYIGPRTYARIKANSTSFDPDTISDADLKAKADYYFGYGTDGKVAEQYAQGVGASDSTGSGPASGLIEYAYVSDAHPASGANVWANRTVVTLPSGTGGSDHDTQSFTPTMPVRRS